MTNVKLSQIAPSPSNVDASTQFVAVEGGNTDYLFTPSQFVNGFGLARLTVADQVLNGGWNVTPHVYATGNVGIDCGQSPLQQITNNGTFTITAPGSDGSCLLQITNTASAGPVTFSGFTVNPGSTGDSFNTTNGNTFVISISRINGVSTYFITALQALGTPSIINVRQYGAVGDGVTDDTAAVQAAFTAAQIAPATANLNRKVYFPPGSYLISNTITLPNAPGADCSIVVYGDGEVSKLIMNNTFTTSGGYLFDRPETSSTSNSGIFGFYQLYFTSGGAGPFPGTGAGYIRIRALVNPFIEKCSFQYPPNTSGVQPAYTTVGPTAIVFGGVFCAAVRDCDFRGGAVAAGGETAPCIGQQAIAVADSTGQPQSVVISNCNLIGWDYGIVWGAFGGIVENCRFEESNTAVLFARNQVGSSASATINMYECSGEANYTFVNITGSGGTFIRCGSQGDTNSSVDRINRAITQIDFVSGATYQITLPGGTNILPQISTALGATGTALFTAGYQFGVTITGTSNPLFNNTSYIATYVDTTHFTITLPASIGTGTVATGGTYFTNSAYCFRISAATQRSTFIGCSSTTSSLNSGFSKYAFGWDAGASNNSYVTCIDCTFNNGGLAFPNNAYGSPIWQLPTTNAAAQITCINCNNPALTSTFAGLPGNPSTSTFGSGTGNGILLASEGQEFTINDGPVAAIGNFGTVITVGGGTNHINVRCANSPSNTLASISDGTNDAGIWATIGATSTAVIANGSNLINVTNVTGGGIISVGDTVSSGTAGIPTGSTISAVPGTLLGNYTMNNTATNNATLTMTALSSVLNVPFSPIFGSILADGSGLLDLNPVIASGGQRTITAQISGTPNSTGTYQINGAQITPVVNLKPFGVGHAGTILTLHGTTVGTFAGNQIFTLESTKYTLTGTPSGSPATIGLTGSSKYMGQQFLSAALWTVSG